MPLIPLLGPVGSVKTLGTGYVSRNHVVALSQSRVSIPHLILPQDLVSDIQQFVESEFARQYFPTQHMGFISKLKVPVGAVRTFRAVQRHRRQRERHHYCCKYTYGSKRHVGYSGGLTYSEQRGEIYCQVMKQLTSNLNSCALSSFEVSFFGLS